MLEVAKDRAYFEKSGGGVTFSGGEPLDQTGFLVPCIERFLGVGITVAIESCLAVEPASLAAVLPYPVEWLVDVKHTDPEKFLGQTAGRVDQVLTNLRTLARSSSSVTFRIPLIPGFQRFRGGPGTDLRLSGVVGPRVAAGPSGGHSAVPRIGRRKVPAAGPGQPLHPSPAERADGRTLAADGVGIRIFW